MLLPETENAIKDFQSIVNDLRKVGTRGDLESIALRAYSAALDIVAEVCTDPSWKLESVLYKDRFMSSFSITA